MNLPFSPTFFRKMDIFQQLMEYEKQSENKHLWKGEKAVLVWGASDQHQFLDEGINWENVKSALDYCVGKKFITEFEKNELSKPTLRTHTIQTFPIREFGNFLDKDGSKVRINKNGILAGAILIETSFLKRKWKYQAWIFIWWVILVVAGLLLLLQTFIAAKSLFASSLYNQEKVSKYFHDDHPRRMSSFICKF